MASPQKWGPFIDFEAKPGTKRSLGEADLFVPFAQTGTSLLFANVRARLDDDSDQEGNFGLGFRHMLDSGWNLGVYGYFDRRRTSYDNYFNQATFGGEMLGRDWDFRANAYLPFGDRVKDVDSLNTAELSGATVLFRGGEERALAGFDAEVGWRVPLWSAEDNQQLRVYVGGFRFDDDVVKAVAGPRLRAELTAYQVPGLWDGARLTLGAEYQHDDVRGSQGFAMVRLRVPLQRPERSPTRLTPQERRMVDHVVRDVDVVSQAGNFGAPETVTQTASGQSLTVVSSASTTGANLPTAVTDAGANSTVILSGSFTTNSNATGVITLRSGQTLMGAGSLAIRSASGRVATLTTPTATVTGNVGSSNRTVNMATNSTLTGMTINNTDSTGNNALGVGANGVSGARIVNNTIVSTENGGGTAHGIDIVSASSNITVSGNTITARGTSGAAFAIAVQVNGSSATVTRNMLSASGGTTTNAHTDLSGANILTGSSGNTVGAGNCSVSVAGTGATVTYTNAAACGP